MLQVTGYPTAGTGLTKCAGQNETMLIFKSVVDIPIIICIFRIKVFLLEDNEVGLESEVELPVCIAVPVLISPQWT